MPDPLAVKSMFGRIARKYDVANHLLSLGLDIGWRRALVKAVGLCQPRDILDLATGSGDVAFTLSRELPSGTNIVGMDFCQPMLDEANLKRGALPDAQQIFMAFCQGDGMALPLSDESFDAVTISFGLRNMADRHQSLIEMRRVLRPGGRMFVLEFSQPARWVKPFYYFYLRWIMPLLASLITGDRAAYTYLNESIEKFPDAEALSDEIRAAGFSNVSWTKLSWGTVALHAAVR